MLGVRAILVLTVALIPMLAADAQEVMMPRQVAEAMKSCLPITDVREYDHPYDGPPNVADGSLAVAVDVADAPSFQVKAQLPDGRPPEVHTTTERFFIERADWPPPTEAHLHVVDPNIILFFQRYSYINSPAEIAEADQAAMRRFRDRVLACFDRSSGLTQREAAAVRWYDDLFTTSPPRGSLPIIEFPKTIPLPASRGGLFAGFYVQEAGVGGGSGEGLGYTIRLTAYEAEMRDAWITFGGRFGRSGAATMPPDMADCLIQSPGYCASSPYPAPARPTGEVFSGLAVGGRPAVVSHVTCCNGEYWLVTWYDSVEDISYDLELALAAAERVGAAGSIDPRNVRYARMLTEIAADMVPVRPRDLRGRVPAGALRR